MGKPPRATMFLKAMDNLIWSFMSKPLEVYEAKFGKGKRPPRLYWDAIRTIAGTRDMLRILVFRKGTPVEARDIMRTAWEKTMADADFQKDYKKSHPNIFYKDTSQKIPQKWKDCKKFPTSLIYQDVSQRIRQEKRDDKK